MEWALPWWLSAVAAFMRLGEVLRGAAISLLILAFILVAIYVLEGWLGENRARYRSKHFAHDLVYLLFYQGGIYNLLIGATLVGAMSTHLSFLEIDVLAGLPAPVHWVVYWITLDFIDYWFHRLKHAVPFLWAFHSVHHAQEQMTSVTSWRFHPVEQMIANIVMVVPFLILGLPPGDFLPIVVTMYAFEALQHSQVNWTYGRLYRVFVSPVFHAIHHSTDRQHYDTNFAKIFSGWDFLFGTGVAGEPRPARTGINPPIPESLPAQLLAPFRLLRPAAPAAQPPPVTERTV